MTSLAELKSLSPKDREVLLEVKNIIRKFQPSATMFLFGSFARGAQRSESDYDILVLTDDRVSSEEENRIEDEIYDLMLAQTVVINTVYHTRKDWDSSLYRAMRFHQEIDRDAVIV